LVHRRGIVLVEGDGIWTRLEIDFETPSEMLFIVLRGNHQVISAWWGAGRNPFFTSDDWVRLTQIGKMARPERLVAKGRAMEHYGKMACQACTSDFAVLLLLALGVTSRADKMALKVNLG
jgi:hypothetical protein